MNRNAKEDKHTVYLLTGSNLGDRKKHLDGARQNMCRHAGRLIAESSLYESEPWGFVADSCFLNQVLVYDTRLTPDEILQIIRTAEAESGRIRTQGGYSSRSLDIDILFYDNLVLDSPDLTIPHPALHKRRFTLLPLAEIAPDFIHPVFGLNICQLLDKCDDSGKVNKL
jgi:2-amino-4-hydroxy-6-hydroxymethyldihydropteridine diphosphokinase